MTGDPGSLRAVVPGALGVIQMPPLGLELMDAIQDGTADCRAGDGIAKAPPGLVKFTI